MSVRIDLNCDLGEELDAWAPGVDGLDTVLFVNSGYAALGGPGAGNVLLAYGVE